MGIGTAITAPSPTSISGGIGTALPNAAAGPGYVVAPSNASVLSRRSADVVLPGGSDQIALNALIASLSNTTGGTINILEGQVNLTDDISIQKNNVNIRGQWRATYIKKQAGSLRGGINVGLSSSTIPTGILLDGLTMDGNYSDGVGVATGIEFGASASVITNCDIKLYRGDGIHFNAWDNVSSIFEIFCVNTFVRGCGGHHFNIGPTILNSEWERCFPVGGNIRGGHTGYGGYGFFVEGAGLSFLLCHPYFCFLDGLYGSNLSGDIKITGGEYETNDGCGIKYNGTGILQVMNASFYANNTIVNGATQQISTSGGNIVQLIGNRIFTIGTVTTKVVEINASLSGVVADNNINMSGASAVVRGIAIEASSAVEVNNNTVINGTTAAAVGIGLSSSSKCVVAENTVSGAIVESGTSDINHIHDNSIVAPAATPAITAIGASTKVRQNIGHNTESSSNASVVVGQSSILVNHGLAVAPTFVMLTVGTGGPQNATTWWVSGITATQFQINTNNVIAGANVLFWWTAYVGNL